MKNVQFQLFKRIFTRRRYNHSVFLYNKPAFRYSIYLKNKALFITEHFLHLNVDHKFLVYNGKNYRPMKISVTRVGHRFGEFIRTKKQSRLIHISKRNQRKAEKMYMKAHGMLKKQRKTKK